MRLTRLLVCSNAASVGASNVHEVTLPSRKDNNCEAVWLIRSHDAVSKSGACGNNARMVLVSSSLLLLFSVVAGGRVRDAPAVFPSVVSVGGRVRDAPAVFPSLLSLVVVGGVVSTTSSVVVGGVSGPSFVVTGGADNTNENCSSSKRRKLRTRRCDRSMIL